jgi:nucleotidyltransferase DUF2204
LRGISLTLRNIIQLLDNQSIPYMLIGGFALPAYGQIRATQDVDMAIAANFKDSSRFQAELQKTGFQLASPAHPDAPVFVVTDLENMVEIEIWTKPDGVSFDRSLLDRRWKVRPFEDDPAFQVFIIGPEDFIVNKLARSDRRAQDEADAASVLAKQNGKIDQKYLWKRAEAAGVRDMLEEIVKRVETVKS